MKIAKKTPKNTDAEVISVRRVLRQRFRHAILKYLNILAYLYSVLFLILLSFLITGLCIFTLYSFVF